MVTENVLAERKERVVNYEMVVVFSPEIAEEQLETAIGNISNFITTHGGEVAELNRWGKRTLAYPLKHFTSGTYVLFKFTLRAAACREMEGNLKISEQVLRHLLIKLDK